jgi:hypothetical protein
VREGDHLEHPGVDGKKILKFIFKKWDGGMDWIDLDQDRERCWAVLNAILNFGFHKTPGILEWLRICQIFQKDSAPWSL